MRLWELPHPHKVSKRHSIPRQSLQSIYPQTPIASLFMKKKPHLPFYLFRLSPQVLAPIPLALAKMHRAQLQVPHLTSHTARANRALNTAQACASALRLQVCGWGWSRGVAVGLGGGEGEESGGWGGHDEFVWCFWL